MISHMDVFVLTTFYRKQWNLSDKAIIAILEDKYNAQYLITPDDIKLFESAVELHPPTLAQQIRTFKKLGYQPKFIAEYLNIPPATVTYHSKNDNGKPYVNTAWRIQVEPRIREILTKTKSSLRLYDEYMPQNIDNTFNSLNQG